MLKKIIIVSLVLIGSIKAHAQGDPYGHYTPVGSTTSGDPYAHYTPIGSTLPPPPTYNIPQFQTAFGYIITSTGVKKVSLRYLLENKQVKVVAVKELTANAWTSLQGTSSTGQKLTTNEPYSTNFEYKVYIAVLGSTVYF